MQVELMKGAPKVRFFRKTQKHWKEKPEMSQSGQVGCIHYMINRGNWKGLDMISVVMVYSDMLVFLHALCIILLLVAKKLRNNGGRHTNLAL